MRRGRSPPPKKIYMLSPVKKNVQNRSYLKNWEPHKKGHSCKIGASDQFQPTLLIWPLLKKVEFFGAQNAPFWTPAAPKRDMMWHEILRPSLFLAHSASFRSRWSLLKEGWGGVCISLVSKQPKLIYFKQKLILFKYMLNYFKYKMENFKYNLKMLSWVILNITWFCLNITWCFLT